MIHAMKHLPRDAGPPPLRCALPCRKTDAFDRSAASFAKALFRPYLNLMQTFPEQPLAHPLWRYDDDTMEKYAQLLLWALGEAREAPFRKSDLVLVRYDLEALPLAEAVVGAIYRDGRVPVPRMEPTAGMQREFLLQANNKRLTMEIPGERELYSALSGSIRIMAPEAQDHLDGVDPELGGAVHLEE